MPKAINVPDASQFGQNKYFHDLERTEPCCVIGHLCLAADMTVSQVESVLHDSGKFRDTMPCRLFDVMSPEQRRAAFIEWMPVFGLIPA